MMVFGSPHKLLGGKINIASIEMTCCYSTEIKTKVKRRQRKRKLRNQNSQNQKKISKKMTKGKSGRKSNHLILLYVSDEFTGGQGGGG